MMFRISLASALLVSTWIVASAALADEPATVQGDQLFQAIRELQREIELLRGELRGEAPPVVKPAMSAPAPQMRAPEPAKPPAAQPRSLALPPVSIARAKSQHWAFQQIQQPAVPRVEDEAWVRDELDHFILARLEAAELPPGGDADRYALLRRVAFDLTGLAPSETEIRSFVNDPAPLDEALARVVDAYLASPRFGERWGRHWLDVVRYADSVGRNWNAPFTYARRYRDYVIDAMNQDKPYDRFLVEQLAGDLLPADDLATRREKDIATGFLALGPIDIIEPEGESLMMDRIDEQIDVITRAMLGLTVSCARCHDHKYEPITMQDYYALAGVFYSTRTYSGQRRGNYVADDDLRLLASADGRTSPVPGIHSMADISREHRSGAGYREVLYTTDPNLAMGAGDQQAQDCPIRLDGEAHKYGPVPARGDFHIGGLSGLGKIPNSASGRLQLARWMVSPDNPLTARVMTNRVWHHLLGRGLVPSLDNFGSSGEEPTHAELLDHLASRFRENWSVKSLVRSIMLSRTYRQTSAVTDAKLPISQQQALYGRAKLRRLEMEAVRDAMLLAAGRLTFERPQGIQVAGTGGKGRWGETRSLQSIDAPYRTVYLPVFRGCFRDVSDVRLPQPHADSRAARSHNRSASGVVFNE